VTRTYGWGLLALAAAMQGCVMAPPPPPPPPPHHHEHRPPPPEFMRACEGQQEGATVQLTGRYGEPLKGTCQRAPDGRLVFMPPPPPQR